MVLKPTIKTGIDSIFNKPKPPTSIQPGPTIQSAQTLPAVTPKIASATSVKPAISVPAPKPTITPPTPPPSGAFGGVPADSDPAMVGGRAMLDARTPVAPPAAPASAPKVDAKAAQLKALQDSYLGTFNPTKEETDTTSQLDAISARQAMMSANSEAGQANVADQPIAQTFVSGQQASMQRQLAAMLGQEAAKATPLSAKLAQLQAQRTAQKERTKAEVDFATPKKEDYQTVGEGQTLVDSSGKVIYQGAAKPVAEKEPKVIGSNESGYYERQSDGTYKQVVGPSGSTSDGSKGVVVGGKIVNPVTGAVIYDGDDKSTSQAATDSLKEKVTLVDSLLSSGGLAGSVGAYGISRWTPFSSDLGERQTFAAGVNQLIGQETMDSLLNLKAQGGTLGALSDGEKAMLQQAATRIGTWMQKDDKGNPTGKFEVPEAEFKNELNRIKGLALKAIAAAEGTGKAGEVAGVKDGFIVDPNAFLDSF